MGWKTNKQELSARCFAMHWRFVAIALLSRFFPPLALQCIVALCRFWCSENHRVEEDCSAHIVNEWVERQMGKWVNCMMLMLCGDCCSTENNLQFWQLPTCWNLDKYIWLCSNKYQTDMSTKSWHFGQCKNNIIIVVFNHCTSLWRECFVLDILCFWKYSDGLLCKTLNFERNNNILRFKSSIFILVT